MNYCVIVLLRFPPACKYLVDVTESFLCGFGGNHLNLHRSRDRGAVSSPWTTTSVASAAGVDPSSTSSIPPPHNASQRLGREDVHAASSCTHCDGPTFRDNKGEGVYQRVVEMEHLARWN